MHPDGLAKAKALATRGLCLFCEMPLPAPTPRGGRPRMMCGSRDCLLAYFRAHSRDVHWHPARSAP